MPDTIEDIVNLVRSGIPNPNETSPEVSDAMAGVPQLFSSSPYTAGGTAFPAPQKPSSGATVVKPLEYNVSPFAVYDRLNDGTYVSKYPNIIGAEGNEERLAREQGTGEKWWNGLVKFKNKTLNYALDATVGTVYGIYQGITTGDFTQVWDNDFSNWMDDTNTKLENRLSHYYTEEEKSMGVLESMGTANFWANDFLGGLAFVGGALLPELALGAISGGATLPAGMAKFGARLGMKGGLKGAMKGTAKSGVNKLDDFAKFNTAETAMNSVGNLRRANFMNSVGTKLNTSRFLVQTSNFEAGMEARHNLHEAVDNYYESFQEMYGRMPSYEEATEFMNSAVRAGNYVYTANMAILSVSNAAMFGAKFNVGIKPSAWLNNAGNRLIGLGYKRTGTGKLAMQEATRLQKVAGNVYKTLEKPAVEGLYEEGLQGVAGSTMQNYLSAKYDPSIEEGYDLWASFTDALNHQYTSNEGWKEMAIGMLIGFGAPGLQGQAPGGLGKSSYKSRRKDIEEQVTAANESQTQLGRNITTRVNDATGVANFAAQVKSKADKFQSTSVDNALINAQYIKVQEQVKSRSQVLKDYDAVVDQMQLSDDQIREIGGQDMFDQYKTSLKDEFRRNMDDYEFAVKSVNSLGLNRRLKGSPANVRELEDAVVMTIMTGKSALGAARNTADQIDNLIGTSGVFNHLEHFNNLSKEQKGKLKERNKKKARLKKLTEQADKYGRELAGVQTDLKAKFSDEVKQRRKDRAAEKRVLVQQEIIDLTKEIEVLDEALNEGLMPDNFNLDQKISTDSNTHDIVSMIEELDKVNSFTSSLRKVGKNKEADILDNLVNEFKIYSDAHREMNNMVRRMYDSNFFKTGEGKAFMTTVNGEKYKMSDEFREIIKENDELIDASMRKAGLRSERTVEEEMEEMFGENNTILSDREKHKMEAVFRLQLGYNALRQRILTLEQEATIVDSVEVPSNNPLDGDTVTLRSTLDPGSKDLGNVEVLNSLIKQIFDELDQFRLGRVDQVAIDKLEERLEELKSQMNETDIEIGKEIVEGLRKDLEAEEKLEEGFRNEETISKLKDQINRFEETYGVKAEEEIQEIEKELEKLKATKNTRIIGSPEYKRINELQKKRARTGELTEEEAVELRELEEDLDQWMTITGIVAEGMRLSDLIQQRNILESTIVEPVQKVVTPSSDQVLSGVHIPDKTGVVHYSIPQTYEGVTAVRNDKTGKIEVSGITWDAFMEEAGIPKNLVELDKNNKPKGGILKLDKRGNILLDQDIVDEINKEGNLSIIPTNESLTSNYSMVLKHTPSTEGGVNTTVLQSNFTKDFKKAGVSSGKRVVRPDVMQPDAIYDIQPGDEITLEVSPVDEYNEELLENYRKARKDSTKQKAIEELQDGLVIRVRTKKGNKFVAVLKAKRYEGRRSEKEAQIFEGLRDSVINDKDFLDSLLNTKSKRNVKLDGSITVKKVYVGHPSFNFKKTGSGQVAIESKPLTDKDIEKVVDIGFALNGKTNTKSGKSPDTTFLKKAMDATPNKKLPFVVVIKGNTEIAIPVELDPKQKAGLEEFENIYKSNMTDSDKAGALNTFMASRGIDIKQPGNSFVAIGGSNNLTDEFYSKKLAELEGIDYFRDLESWVKPGRDMALLLRDGVSTSVNLADPVHSPKISLDYSKLNVEVSEKNIPDEQPINEKTADETLGSFDELLDSARKKDC